MVAGGGSGAVVTVWTTVVPGSVTVSSTVRGAVVPVVSPSSRASSAAARMPASEGAPRSGAAPARACALRGGAAAGSPRPRRPGRPVERVAQRSHELGGGAEPVLGLLCEAAGEHVVELVRQGRIRAPRPAGSARSRGPSPRPSRTRARTGACRQELEGDDREGVEVARRRRRARRGPAPGARYPAVPTTVPTSVKEPRSAALATPKSATLTRSSLSSRRLAGLTSRWTIPFACAASSAAAACPSHSSDGRPAGRPRARGDRRASRPGGTPSRCRGGRRARRRRRSSPCSARARAGAARAPRA